MGSFAVSRLSEKLDGADKRKHAAGEGNNTTTTAIA